MSRIKTLGEIMHNPPLLTIQYDPYNGDSFTDGEISLYIEMLQQVACEKIYCVGSFSVISAILTAIAKDYLDYNDIVFQYKDSTFTANQYGVCVDAPRDFFDPGVLCCEQRLLAATAKRRNNR